MVAQILPRLIDIFTFEYNKKKLAKKKVTMKKRRDVLKYKKIKTRPSIDSLEYDSNKEGSDISSNDDEYDEYMAEIKFVKQEVPLVMDV